MNRYVEDYIARRKDEIVKEKEKERMKLLAKLRVGEKEYWKSFPSESMENFPFYDDIALDRYRYNAGEITDEEYNELLKYAPKNHHDDGKHIPSAHMFCDFWCCTVLGCIF